MTFGLVDTETEQDRPYPDGHTCTAWCGDGQHCGITYVRDDPGQMIDFITRRLLRVHYPLRRLIRIERAPEAPPSSVMEVHHTFKGDDTTGPTETAWRYWFTYVDESPL